MTKVTDTQSNRAEVRALVALIGTAAEAAMDAWEAQEGRVPSLDDLAEEKTPSAALLRAIRLLDGSCCQLQHILGPTFVTVSDKARVNIEIACLRTALQAKVPDILDKHAKGVHIDVIAKETSLDADKLARILRLLTLKHYFSETSKDVFANNRISYSLRSSSAAYDFVGLMTNEINRYGISNLWEALSDPEYGPSTDPKKSAFSWGIHDEMPDANTFQWYEKHPTEAARFNRAMTAFRLGWVTEYYPVAAIPAGSTWCDIGGGMGHVLLSIARANPGIKATLQDQPHVLAHARESIEKEYPQGLREDRVRLVPIDFISESPVKGLDFYYMRFIIHDWPDHIAKAILKNIAQAMKPTSRLLVHDYVLKVPKGTDAAREDSHLGTHDAPRPLLPNYGAGGIRPFLADINMMMVLNARERSVEDVVRLANEAGLEFVKFWDCVETGLVELRLKQ
ncbi:S-adenosyl-L-methionine-dependent methyltransferase [Dentipellis sp. KUC8613]|nr:S-adenosyl-L-methionine-dependent methyltransferase [Dentipellis sp. KUC8613]